MDIETSNRIYDELTLTIGMRLLDAGAALRAGDIDVLATDRDRDAGVDHACSLGRLAVDTGDFAAIRRSLEAQDDRIRSIIAMPGSADPAFVVVQRADLSDAKFRRSLVEAFLRNDRDAMRSAYAGIMRVHAGRR